LCSLRKLKNNEEAVSILTIFFLLLKDFFLGAKRKVIENYDGPFKGSKRGGTKNITEKNFVWRKKGKKKDGLLYSIL